MAGSTAALAARCKNVRRGSFIFTSLTSFYHLVGAGEQRRGHIDAKHLGRLEVDYQFELGRRLNRQVGRLGTLENAAGIAANATIHVCNAGSVADQQAGFGPIAAPDAEGIAWRAANVANWTRRL